MKKSFGFLCGLAFFGVHLAAAATSPKSITVRGVKMALPIEIRVLLDELNKSRILEISGDDLRDDRGTLTGDDTVTCMARRDPTFFLGFGVEAALENAATWVCQGENYRRVITGPVRFTPGSGFLTINKETYRHAIDLVPAGEQLMVINSLGLEEYLAGLVNREIRSNYPPEAVKAQVIAARSYALATAADRRRQGQPFDMYGTIQDQVYRGGGAEDGASFRLVNETQGQVLLHRNDILKAYYHASSGGHSELPQYVWGDANAQRDALAYLARPSQIDQNLPETKWKIRISPQMGFNWPGIGKLFDIHIIERSPGQRVRALKLMGSDGEQTMSGTDFRKMLGINWVKSTYFFVHALDSGWLLEGRGFGHGVGLSQLGAKALAKGGKKADEILSYYYPFSNVQKLKLDEAGSDITIGTR